MAKTRTKGRKKLTRSARKKGYYDRFRQKYSGKLIRRRADQEKRQRAAKEHPEIGSPSQIRIRKKLKSVTKDNDRDQNNNQ